MLQLTFKDPFNCNTAKFLLDIESLFLIKSKCIVNVHLIIVYLL